MDPNTPPSPLTRARLASSEATPQALHLVFPTDEEEGEAISVHYSLTDDALIVTYKVTTRDIHPEKISDTQIYNGNVVELFICPTARPGQVPRPYYEFEVSPYNQQLQVLIDIKGKFNEKWNTEKFRHSAAIQAARPGWDAVMEIPLKELGWTGDPATITGNAFAILGAKGMRRFYSAYLPRQQKPNFHQPSFFKPFPLNDGESFSSARDAS
jgi:hypothetical protein